MPARKVDFWSRVSVGAPGECWPWLGPITDGYGRHGKRSIGAHRLSYEELVGPIPDGHQLDHLCHGADEVCAGGSECPHRRCVNPAHLEPVPQVENIRRGRSFAVVNRGKAACHRGHAFDVANTYVMPNGWRSCRACRRGVEQGVAA